MSSEIKSIMGRYLEIVFNYELKSSQSIMPRDNFFSLWQDLSNFWKREFEKTVTYLKDFEGMKQYYISSSPYNPRFIYYGKEKTPEFLEIFPAFIKRSSLYSDLIILFDPLPPLITLHQLGYSTDISLSSTDACINKMGDFDDPLDVFGVIESTRSVRSFTNGFINYTNLLRTFQDWIREGIIIVLPDVSYPRVRSAILSFKAVDIGLKNCGALNAIPSTDDEIAWYVLKEKIEASTKILPKDSFVLEALREVNLKFLNNVTPDFALKIREEGYLSELRSFFREKFGEIQKIADQPEFYEFVNNYSIEILDEIKKYEREWKDIKKNAFEKIGVKGSLALVSGVLGGAVSFGLTIPAWIGVLGGTLLSSNYTIKDIADEILKLTEKRRDLHRNAAYLLYILLRICFL